ncbi:hypothetical protein OC844_001758 [Tilletia horrida]|nr:hypothetical protein OC844_001758 [Tilletia horrida]
MFSRSQHHPEDEETVLPLTAVAGASGERAGAGSSGKGRNGDRETQQGDAEKYFDDEDGHDKHGADEYHDDEDAEERLVLPAPSPAWKYSSASGSSNNKQPHQPSSSSSSSSPLRRIARRLRQRWFSTLLYLAALLVVLNMVFGDGSNIGVRVSSFARKLASSKSWSAANSLTGTGAEASWAKAAWVEEPVRTDLHYDTPFNRDDLTLTEGECDAFFPGLWKDIERAEHYYARSRNPWSRDYLERSCSDETFSQLRVVIYHNRLYIKKYKQSDFTRTQTTLSLLQQAITSSRERLPNVEFCMDLQDWGSHGLFSLSRAPQQDDVWLMPDYAFFAWKEHIGGSYKEFREKSAELEKQIGWEGKVNKLFWRGSIHVGTEDREAMLAAAKGYPWNDAQPLDWSGDRHEWVSMIDHCKWKFHGFPEGNTYSGRLRYLQHCRSVIVTHEPRWIQHWTHLYNANSSSPDQNIVFVPLPKDTKAAKGDIDKDPAAVYGALWERLPEVMDELLRDDAKAKRIADNQWTFMRERYVSPASAACYWRKALKAFGRVQNYDVDLTGREISYEDHMLNGFPQWPIPEA